ncbi:MAG: hypothetical protein LBR92_03290 [Puniceicoccales bacterium]|jgi:glycyl-tRNA synthetase|nr:hypothetical protein [Puniceicoccales bacterium]
MRAVLKLHPRVAPIKAAVLPLVKNRPELVSLAEKIYQKLSKKHLAKDGTITFLADHCP